MLLGAIADDMTGATDLALMLSKSGMMTVQVIGPEAAAAAPPDAEAVVVAMKSRTNPPDAAVAMSRKALAALRAGGAEQVLFKYCSTFDSTAQGNIGPVADALLADLDAPIAIACSAFPDAGRTIYQGHLFVGDRLLSESGMRNHPLTPRPIPIWCGCSAARAATRSDWSASPRFVPVRMRSGNACGSWRAPG